MYLSVCLKVNTNCFFHHLFDEGQVFKLLFTRLVVWHSVDVHCWSSIVPNSHKLRNIRMYCVPYTPVVNLTRTCYSTVYPTQCGCLKLFSTVYLVRAMTNNSPLMEPWIVLNFNDIKVCVTLNIYKTSKH